MKVPRPSGGSRQAAGVGKVQYYSLYLLMIIG